MTYFGTHSIPLLVSKSIPRHIVHFREEENEDNKNINNNQMRVSGMIQWFIRCQIYVCRNNISKLHAHYDDINRM